MKKISFLIALLIAYSSIASAQYSLYQDYKAKRIGDIITIVLQENISGATSDDNSNRAGVNGGAQGSIAGNLSPFLPLFGANASIDYQSNDRSSAQQSQLLRGTISARIEEIMPNGDLYLVGSRSNEINGELHKMEIKGYARSNDVDGYNQILSYRIANAEIVYIKQGGEKTSLTNSPNFWQKAIWFTLGIGLGVAAYLGVF